MELFEERRSCKTSLHNSFYIFSFQHCPHPAVEGLLWILEKLTVMALVFLLIFSPSINEDMGRICANLVLLPWLNPSNLALFGDVLTGLVLIGTSLLVLRVLYFTQGSSVATFCDYTLSYYLCINYRLIVQFLCLSFLLLALMLNGDPSYPEYKRIASTNWDLGIETHVVHICICILGFCLSVLTAFLYIKLYQRKKMILWCGREWEINVIGLAVKLALFGLFIIDKNDTLILLSSIIYLALFSTTLFMRNFMPIPLEYLGELADQFFEGSMAFLEFIICIGSLYSKYELSQTYQYALLAPFIGILACQIKIANEAQPAPIELKTEEDALDYTKKVVSLCIIKDEYSGLMELSGMLAVHFRHCTRPDCKCEKLLKQMKSENFSNSNLEENAISYENRKFLPNSIKKSWKTKVLQVLLFDIKTMHSSVPLKLVLSEIEFIFLGNYSKSRINSSQFFLY